MRLPRPVLAAIVAHARADAPLECCGLLIGSGETIVESYPVKNTRRSPVAFEVEARAAGLAVIGAYHSHPRSPAAPSETDIREANDPEFVHVIVSLVSDPVDVRAFRIVNRAVLELALWID